MGLIFVDDSRHEKFGFILGSCVCTDNPNINGLVSEALRAHGLIPGVDEYKSRLIMQGNSQLQKLRERLFGILYSTCKYSFFVVSEIEKKRFGIEATKAISKLTINHFPSSSMEVYLDQGLFPGRKDRKRVV